MTTDTTNGVGDEQACDLDSCEKGGASENAELIQNVVVAEFAQVY